MLETSRERIKLIKAGYSQKEIEEIYLEKNNFIISLHPFLFEIVELNLENNQNLMEDPSNVGITLTLHHSYSSQYDVV
ncbi:MAG: hypothetical protein M8353_08755 [ANME-2 cluster archaeon]|nr:hypothetical protein [ANME-2 cluster archaeon]